jgi:hypothetical protein
MKIKSISLIFVIFIFTFSAAFAAPIYFIPSVDGKVRLDLNPDDEFDLLPVGGVPAMPNPVVGGLSGVLRTGEWVQFNDFIFAGPWSWETEIYNPNYFGVSFQAGWYYPGNQYVAAINLNPFSSFYIDLVFKEIPEMGNWQWTCRSSLNYDIGVDTSVVEDSQDPGVYLSNAAGTQLIFELVPEPATIILLSIGLMGIRRR